MILAGDIGGTNSRLAFALPQGERFKIEVEQTYSSREHDNLESVVADFVARHGRRVEHACFGVAGPVRHGRCEATNLPWAIDARRLARQLDLPAAGLINDLEANAYGIAVLEDKDFVVLNPGDPGAEGNAAILSAGTGLGEAGLYWDGRRHRVFASEGGHADFAPRTELEIDLLRHLLTLFDRVSYERVLSGPGLLHIYEFLRDTGRGEEPLWLAEKMRGQDPAAVISREALEGKSETCARALELFVSLYGAEAGNLALKIMATGGLFLGGGIAPKIVAKLKEPGFLEAFTDKGRMKPLLEAVPVRVILNDMTALLGAARCAATFPGGDPRAAGA